MPLNDTTKYALAKTFTELAIQNGLLNHCEDATEAANEVTTFFNTIMATIGSATSNKQ